MYQTLNNLIMLLSQQTNAHICIHDVSGILTTSTLTIDFNNQIHSKDFCTAAKNSPRGYLTCIGCKMLANEKAITHKTMFCGYCPYGLYEVVKPVVIDNKVHCIIFIGNMIFNYKETESRIIKTCNLTKAPQNDILEHLKESQKINSIDYYIKTADLVDSYIRLLYKENNGIQETNQLHWAVLTLKNYIDNNFNQNISLKALSKLYFINDKYIGRLFKKQIGLTFHEYLNKIRLENSEVLLINSNKNIIEVSINCGFQNVTYFNRMFLKKYKIQPTAFRLKYK